MREVNDMKEHCTYGIFDIETGVILIKGNKWKETFGLVPLGSFRSGFFGVLGSKITTYGRKLKVKNRDCFIFYYANSPQREAGSCITMPGRLMGLRGKWYDQKGFFKREPAIKEALRDYENVENLLMS